MRLTDSPSRMGWNLGQRGLVGDGCQDAWQSRGDGSVRIIMQPRPRRIGTDLGETWFTASDDDAVSIVQRGLR